MKRLVEGAKQVNGELDELKRRVREYYEEVKEELLNSLTQDEKAVQEQLNRFYFQYLNSGQIKISLMC